MIKSFGFPSMLFEMSEKRDFRPQFFMQFKDITQSILLDYGYGEKLGFKQIDYLKAHPGIAFTERENVFGCDCIVSIRTPDLADLEVMKKGSTILSMLHFVTHAYRNSLLHDKKVTMIALDSITDDFGLRMIQDFPGTVSSAISSAYQVFDKSKFDNHINLLILGTGELGKLSVDLAVHLTDYPVLVTSIGKQITKRQDIMNKLLKKTDILVDSTKRVDTSKFVVNNEQVGLLPEHAVIVDLSADDYDTKISPIQVKGIEGIPTGSLDKYVLCKDDDSYNSIPKEVSTINRRTVVSCYSWPGVNAHGCLDRYEQQLLPFIKYISKTEEMIFDGNSDDLYEKALHRATYDSFKNGIIH